MEYLDGDKLWNLCIITNIPACLDATIVSYVLFLHGKIAKFM